ncbi:MAG TPA: PilZ domain-containing protein [Myxococcota bacterium]|nr:PilZ domain-containing protein [Myxococcota bacterium]HRY94811.1 PilZ domain-containing protein [Myxococcota bacterium]HSA22303.1 PilZ domain-containing protein [Myxococcota bacterium]
MHARIQDRRHRGDRRRAPQRRRYPRLRCPLEGFFEGSERMLLVRVTDLNLRGAFLATPAPEGPGPLATLRLQLPGSPAMLRMQVEVLWSNDEPLRGTLGMGVRFVGLLPWQLKRLAALLLGAGGLDAFPRLHEARVA